MIRSEAAALWGSAGYGWETRTPASTHQAHLPQYAVAKLSKQPSPKLNDVMTNLIDIVNHIKVKSLDFCGSVRRNGLQTDSCSVSPRVQTALTWEAAVQRL